MTKEEKHDGQNCPSARQGGASQSVPDDADDPGIRGTGPHGIRQRRHSGFRASLCRRRGVRGGHHHASHRHRPDRLDPQRPRSLHRQGRGRSRDMAEIYGKATGACRGKGGSMHIADLSKGMMGANGILGAGAPLICGAGLAAKYRGDGGVGITFFGDGASHQGTVLESMNLAAIWSLPVIFVVENNGYAESTSVDYATAVDSYVDRASGFGLPGVTVDGTDFFAVYEAAGEMIRRAREGGGPSLLECKTVRFFGHFEGDAQTYKAKGENDLNRATRDCIKEFAARVSEAGAVSAAEFAAIDKEVVALINDAVASAAVAPLPTLEDLTSDVYVTY